MDESQAPSAADLDAVVGEQETAELTAGESTPVAEPVVPDQGGPEEHAAAAPDSIPNLTSHGVAIPGSPHNSSIDSDVHDSLGTPKSDAGLLGPRGEGKTLDVMTDAEKAAVNEKIEARLNFGMSSTDNVDSVGNSKGIDNPPMVGPRGVGAPKDSWHGKRS